MTDKTHDAETVERVAAAIWRSESIDSGTPESVTNRRTLSAFADQSTESRLRLHKLARAALSALPPQEVSVQEAARVLGEADNMDFLYDLGEWLNENGGKQWGKVWASHMVKRGLRATAQEQKT